MLETNEITRHAAVDRYVALAPDPHPWNVDERGDALVYTHDVTEGEEEAIQRASAFTEERGYLGYRHAYEASIAYVAASDRYRVLVPIEEPQEETEDDTDSEIQYEEREVVTYEVLPVQASRFGGEVGYRDDQLRFTRTINAERAKADQPRIELAVVSTELDFTAATSIRRHEMFSRQVMALAQLLQLGQADRAVILGPNDTRLYMILREEPLNLIARAFQYHETVNKTMLRNLADIFIAFSYDAETRAALNQILEYRAAGHTRAANQMIKKLQSEELRSIARRLTPDHFHNDNLILSLAHVLAQSGIFLYMAEEKPDQGTGIAALAPAA